MFYRVNMTKKKKILFCLCLNNILKGILWLDYLPFDPEFVSFRSEYSTGYNHYNLN